MTTYAFDKQKLGSLKGKTMLIVGAATGIGRAALDIAWSTFI